MDLTDSDVFIAEFLRVAEKKFKDGNNAVVLMAIHECFLLEKPIPEWLRLAFLRAYQSATGFEIRSWDEAFGAPHPKGVHLKARKKLTDLRFPIWLRARKLAASGFKTDKSLFEKIGAEFGVSGTTVGELYYDERSKGLGKLVQLLNKTNSAKN